MKEEWELSSHRMTVYVCVEDGKIVQSAPIIAKFLGQPFTQLVTWMEKQGGFWKEKLRGEK